MNAQEFLDRLKAANTQEDVDKTVKEFKSKEVAYIIEYIGHKGQLDYLENVKMQLKHL